MLDDGQSMNSNSRYNGRPLLRLLELYVLKVIGELQESDAKTLDLMAPKLRSTYGVSGDWDEVIASVVGLSDGAPQAIQRMWKENSEVAKKGGVDLTPQQFSEMFVDANFDASTDKGPEVVKPPPIRGRPR